MPVSVSYPGVYVEEIPSGVRTITGVSTSIAAFVDYFATGPGTGAVQIFSYADFERRFGGLDRKSEGSYAIQQFFLNGGTQAYVVRTTGAGGTVAAITVKDATGADVLKVEALSAGAWGNSLRVDVDYGAADPTTQFNLTVSQVVASSSGVQVAASEVYRNLVVDSTKSNDAAAVVNNASSLVKLTTAASATGKRPAQTGTASASVDASTLGLTADDKLDVKVGVGGAAPAAVGTTAGLNPVPTTAAGLAAALQSLIRGIKTGSNAVLPNATVSVVGSGAKRYLVVEAGADDPSTVVALADNGSGKIANKLGFDAAGAANVQQYALGGANSGAASGSVQGVDDAWDPTQANNGIATALIGDENAKTGMYALLDVDLFNILCIPATMNLGDDDAEAVAAAAIALCTKRRAIYLIDPPSSGGKRDTVTGIMSWLDANDSLRSRNAALYFPRTDVADALNNFRPRALATSGTMAGVYARTDGARGVWKAPAGMEATLSGVQKLEYKLTDGENGVLNPLAINALRVFPVFGPVSWGARTLMGADQIADDYKYVPVRRLALFLEESLFRGTQWVVFEPNAAPLWAQIRLNVGAFMQNLFRQGAFAGQTPQDAYFVQCDDKNNPQNTIDLGIVNIGVGFAPLKPAEFVIIQIQQIAGDIAT
jgi:hypothetical protein